ncbi:MAG: mandelate racemase/muconate lactonizing enzyme family protein [Candidatus Binatia bacterium]|nr:mandelate racemase/muconate lactonizing enzyme family protein [Candidatus Binatia bacterium]
MRIRAVELLSFSIPLVRPLATARGAIEERRGWIVKLTDERGLVGVGEAAPHPHSSAEDAARESSRLPEIAVRVRDADVFRVREASETLADFPRWIACGLDTALCDLEARARGVTLAELLGGARRNDIPVNAVLEAADLDSCVDEGRRVLAAGYTHAKRKIAGDVATTAAEVRALGAAVPGLALRLDANGIWDRAEAEAACRALAGPNVEWVEQPLESRDFEGLAALRSSVEVPIAVDESVRSPSDVEALARERACDGVVVKLVQVGGLSVACEVAVAAAAAGLPLAVTSGIDTGIGIAAALSFAATVPGSLAACGLSTGSLLVGDLVRDVVRPGPWMGVPSGPGLGVELDEVACARFAVEST